jgi:hypothetical protein
LNAENTNLHESNLQLAIPTTEMKVAFLLHMYHAMKIYGSAVVAQHIVNMWMEVRVSCYGCLSPREEATGSFMHGD